LTGAGIRSYSELNKPARLLRKHATIGEFLFSGVPWNRELGYKPVIPAKDRFPEWHRSVPTPSSKVFMILTILRFMLRSITPQSQWPQRLLQLLQKYDDIPCNFMGFPEDWQRHAIWAFPDVHPEVIP
jgi:abortive infection bacteriophage resistance protein